jgi:predicted glycoside hydrolase/deacetylase ChbG (UPF0249 family)
MAKNLIVTADDYGMNRSINEAVEACLAAGIVKATCVMTNMPEYSGMGILRSAYPKTSLGLHWSLTQGRPVLDSKDVPSLVGPDGNFYPTHVFRKKWLKSEISVSEVKAELDAQYKLFVDLGGKPDFWNTHQDLHIYPGLFQTFVATSLELGIPAMRCHLRFVISNKYSARMYSLWHPLFWMKGKIVNRWSSLRRKITSGCRMGKF